MGNPMTDLSALGRKSDDAGLLRAMIGFAAERQIEFEDVKW